MSQWQATSVATALVTILSEVGKEPEISVSIPESQGNMGEVELCHPSADNSVTVVFTEDNPLGMYHNKIYKVYDSEDSLVLVVSESVKDCNCEFCKSLHSWL